MEENLVSVIIDGVDVTENLVNGSIVLEVKSRPQIIVVSDIAGNTTKMIVNVIGHQGRWEIIQQPTVNQDGIQKNVCPECGETKEEVLPKITFDSNDKINCGGAMGGTTEVFIAVVAMAIIICKKYAKKAA